jgi:hypothetical protein
LLPLWAWKLGKLPPTQGESWSWARRRAAAMALLSHHTGHVPGQLQLSTPSQALPGHHEVSPHRWPPASRVRNFGENFSSLLIVAQQPPFTLHPRQGNWLAATPFGRASNDDRLSRHNAMSRLLVTTGATTTSKPHSVQSVNKDLSLVSGVESYCIVTLSIPIPRVRCLGLKFGSILENHPGY